MTPTEPFTDEELTNLSAQIEAELRQLQTTGSDGQHLGLSFFKEIPRRQRKVIREATGEEAAIFLARFLAVVNRDLCHQDSVLYTIWRRCNDIDNQPLLRATGIAALALGVSSGDLGTVAVAISVCIINWSYKTFCAESPRFKCSALALLLQIVTDDSDRNEHLLLSAFGNIDHWAGMPLRTDGNPSNLAHHWLDALWNRQCIDGEHPLARLLRVAFAFRPARDCDCLGHFQGLLAYLDTPCIGRPSAAVVKDVDSELSLTRIWDGTTSWFVGSQGDAAWIQGRLSHTMPQDKVPLNIIKEIREAWSNSDSLKTAPGFNEQIQCLNNLTDETPSRLLHRSLVKCWFPWMPDEWWKEEKTQHMLHESLKTVIGAHAAVCSKNGSYWPSLVGVYIVLCHTFWESARKDHQKLDGLLNPEWSQVTGENARNSMWLPLQQQSGDPRSGVRYLVAFFSEILFHSKHPERRNLVKVSFGDQGARLTLYAEDPKFFDSLWQSVQGEIDNVNNGKPFCNLGSARGYLARLICSAQTNPNKKLAGLEFISWDPRAPQELVLRAAGGA